MRKTMMMAAVAVMAMSLNALAANLIVNGDFESGVIAPATTEYLALDMHDPGTYVVGTNPQTYHAAWTAFGDHTSGSGEMLILNAACDDGTPTPPGMDVVWEQTVAVVPGIDYALTYWLANSYPVAPASIQVYINDVAVGAPASATGTGTWLEVSRAWNSGASTSAKITLKDLTRLYNGDDFVIDDISFANTEAVGRDSATGMGTRILSKGTWFMCNYVAESVMPDSVGSNVQFDIQAGNPANGDKFIGRLFVWNRGSGNYEVTYVMDDTIEIGGVDYDIVVTAEHLGISNTANFTGKPGQDDNQDFGVQFSDADGNFYVFAHFEVEYW